MHGRWGSQRAIFWDYDPLLTAPLVGNRPERRPEADEFKLEKLVGKAQTGDGLNHGCQGVKTRGGRFPRVSNEHDAWWRQPQSVVDMGDNAPIFTGWRRKCRTYWIETLPGDNVWLCCILHPDLEL